MRKLGFRVARSRTIAALQAGPGYILFEDRAVREGKNLLDTGEVSPEDVVALLYRCRGSPDQYSETGHHREPSIPVPYVQAGARRDAVVHQGLLSGRDAGAGTRDLHQRPPEQRVSGT